ncbi:unnamed protein product [Phytophthora fragariaefolia]|uniref:Unnamed protein product n=1 Tax=Phytophthora fragariaefolia TaxID=1490495 RepID=A0A9W6TP95_9STRA|nr:unnamed protein product [Phytophthora fragariaefolia]
MDGSRHMMDLDPGVRWIDPGIRTCGGSRSRSPRSRSRRLVHLDLIWGGVDLRYNKWIWNLAAGSGLYNTMDARGTT